MGSFLSSPAAKAPAGEPLESSKRLKMSSSCSGDEGVRLIPSLPDEISLLIVARLPRICYLNVKMVSRSWKAAVTSLELFQLRKELRTTEEWLYILTKMEGERLICHALDPVLGRWQRLPPMPDVACEEDADTGLSRFWTWNKVGSGISGIIRGWLGKRDSSELMPFCGCAVGAVEGCLYVLGGFSRVSATKCVRRYDPRFNQWQEVASMTTARAFCKTSLLKNKLYVVGGVSRGTGGLTPLQSAEAYDPRTDSWTEMPSMPFSKAHALPTAFLAELLKPIATGMTSCRGRLYVPQSLYSWPFFVDVGGEIYDPEIDSWVDMPAGMGEGWPARQAGAKLSVVVDGELYALDPSNSSDNGKIKVYDHNQDAWKVVIRKVPIHDFLDSESPYLLAGFVGKLHVITKDDNNHTAVLQADLPMQVSSSSSSSTSLPSAAELACEPRNSLLEEEEDMWKVIGAKNLGAAELVSCQVLDI